MTLQTSPENSLKQTLKNLENPWKNLPKITSKIRPSPDTRFSQKITSRSLTLGSQMVPKMLKKMITNIIAFWIAPRTALGGLWVGLGAQKGVPKGRNQVTQNSGGVPFHI